MYSPMDEIRKSIFRIRPLPQKGLAGFIHSLTGVYHRKLCFDLIENRFAQTVLETASSRYESFSMDELSKEIRTLGLELRYSKKLNSFSSGKTYKNPGESRRAFVKCLKKNLHKKSRLLKFMAAITAGIQRSTGLFPHVEQIKCSLVVMSASIAEFATGEGKTLSLAIAVACLHYMRGKLLILTANDYLAERDCSSFRDFYALCGIECSWVIGSTPFKERKSHYSAGVVYTTAKELTADFLRDRIYYRDMLDGERRLVRYLYSKSISSSMSQSVLSMFDTVLVDEADHLLIDEAVTPLIISEKTRDTLLEQVVLRALEIAKQLKEGIDFNINVSEQKIKLVPHSSEIDKLLIKFKDTPGIMQNHDFALEMIESALRVLYLIKRDVHYIVKEGLIKIIDPGTGRVLADRSWSRGIHQFIEAREGLEFSKTQKSITGISFQNFFRNIPFLGGVTGTAWETRNELWRVYDIPVIRISTHKPCIRKHASRRFFAENTEKINFLVELVKELHSKEIPLLIGTNTVLSSTLASRAFKKADIPHRLLNAENHEKESEIISHAGNAGAVTIATNMAGRGTDIKIDKKVCDLGGLRVIQIEKNLSIRVDRQLYGRCARQGNPGSVYELVSPDEKVFEIGLPFILNQRILKQGFFHGFPFFMNIILWMCQKKNEKNAFKTRVNILENDRWIKETIGL